MYLVEINKETGLVKIDELNDGWLAIKSFKNLYDELGVNAFTCVALRVDYSSPYNHYSTKDRWTRVVDEIYGSREAIDIKNPLIVDAIEKYQELQFNSDLEQESINNDIKIRLLANLKKANDDEDDTNIAQYNKRLQNHENSISQFNKRFDKEESLSQAVTSNGYSLSRIENDIASRKNSKFVNHGTNLNNPNKLELEK